MMSRGWCIGVEKVGDMEFRQFDLFSIEICVLVSAESNGR